MRKQLDTWTSLRHHRLVATLAGLARSVGFAVKRVSRRSTTAGMCARA